MAIIQISKIQHRTGANTDLPQLDEGEFGFATDERRLYIGNDAALYPPSGTSLTTQTEILTQYSNISFSQVEGSANSNLELSNIQDGQLLTINIASNGSTVVNRGGSSGIGNIHLGNVSNVKLLGGVNGYFLQTDGTGNVAWVSKDVLRTPIIALSNTSPVVMTISNSTPYVNKLKVTITGVLGANANTIINGKDFYVKMSNDFPTSGNVTLYTDTTLITPLNGTTLTATANTGYSTALMSDTGGLPSGANSQLQFNSGGSFGASANLTFNTVSNTLTTAYITGILSSLASSQPNITSVGTLVSANIAGTVVATKFTSNVATGTPPLTVSSTTRVDNLNADLLDGYQSASTNTPNTVVVRDSNGNFAANIITATLIGTSLSAITVTSSSQPNITSVGTLDSITVSGNASAGNILTFGNITASGNVAAGNITTGNIVGSGNLTAGNITTNGTATIARLNANTVSSGLIPDADLSHDLGNSTNRWNELYLSGPAMYIGNQTITSNANGVTLSNTTSTSDLAVSGNATVGNLTSSNLVSALRISGSLITSNQPNITSLGNLSSLTVSGNATIGNANLGNLATANYFSGTLTIAANAQPNITSIGTLSSLNVSTTIISLGNIYANSGIIGASFLNGILTTSAQPNITSIGTLSTLGVIGNITSGNVAGGNLVAANYLYGVLVQGNQPNINNIGTLVSLSVSGDITSGNINGGNLTRANYLQGVITTSAQPNITSIGNLISLTVTGNITSGNISAANGTGTFNTLVANNITLNNNLNLINLNASGNVTSTQSVNGNVVLARSEVRIGNVSSDNWGRMRLMDSTSGYGFNFGTPGLVITNEELTLNQAIVLGDSDSGSGTLFGISINPNGNGSPTTGNESGWVPRLRLSGTGDLTINNVIANSITLSAPLSVEQGGTGSNTSTGTGSIVRAVSPTLAGAPLAPTANLGSNTKQIATTEFVSTAIGVAIANVGTGSGLGDGQTWQNFTSSRSRNTTYTNTGTKPIAVYARANSGGTMSGIVSGIEVAMTKMPLSGHIVSVTLIVPAGSTYIINSDVSIVYWSELR